jgi:hypothetical protein
MQAAYLVWLARRGVGSARPRTLFAILAGGAPVQAQRLASRGVDPALARDPDVYLDVASYGASAIELARSLCGDGQLVFGSDLPVIDCGPTLDALSALDGPLGDAVRSANPHRLFG